MQIGKRKYCTNKQSSNTLKLFIYTVTLLEDHFMKTLQAWFNVLAGISEEEQRRLAFAQAIFSRHQPDLSVLERPACWRRRTRCLQNRR